MIDVRFRWWLRRFCRVIDQYRFCLPLAVSLAVATTNIKKQLFFNG